MGTGISSKTVRYKHWLSIDYQNNSWLRPISIWLRDSKLKFFPRVSPKKFKFHFYSDRIAAVFFNANRCGFQFSNAVNGNLDRQFRNTTLTKVTMHKYMKVKISQKMNESGEGLGGEISL